MLQGNPSQNWATLKGPEDQEQCTHAKRQEEDYSEQEKNNEGQYDDGELTSPGPLIDYLLSDDSGVDNGQLLEKIKSFFTSDS